jgi:hypothetical protein
VLAHAWSGDAVFAACLRLFRDYPLAVRRHYAEHRYGSLVLMDGAANSARFFVLIREWDDLFALRPWDRRDGARVEIRRDEPASADARRVIESAVPVPRDGTLLGWLAGRQVRAVFAVYGRLTEPWDDPAAVPGVLVMPSVGSQPGDRPPLAVSPLDDGRLWEYVARGQLADLTPLVSRRPGRVYWVPGASGRAGRPGVPGVPGAPAGARIVVTERLDTDEFWLPAAVYADHVTFRDGTLSRTASQLLALPGVVDLAHGHPGRHRLGA